MKVHALRIRDSYVCLALAAGMVSVAVSCSQPSESETDHAASSGPLPEESQPVESSPMDTLEKFQKVAHTLNESPLEGLGLLKDLLANADGIKAVTHQQLREVLPEVLMGMERKDKSGTKTGFMGFSVAQTLAIYRDDAGRKILVNLHDTGSMSMLTSMILEMWNLADVDIEDETSVEGFKTYRGYKGYEVYDRSIRSGRLNLIAEGRFVVEIQVDGFSTNVIAEVVEELNLDKLKQFAQAPAEPPPS